MTPSSNSVWGDHKSTLDGCSGPSPCQRSSSPPPAAYAPAREKRETKSFTDWQLQYPCTFGDLSAGRAPACRNPVAGRPPLSERLHLIVLLPIPPPLCPPTVPLLPLRILSSQMPPTATLSPGIHLRRYHGESLSRKGTYLIKSDKKVKMSIQGTKKNNH